MSLNKGYPTKNTIVTPKVNHHTLHSPWLVLINMMSLSRFSTLDSWHYCKIMSMPTIEKIHSILIYEPMMPKFCCAKKPTFGNLDWLANHHINGSRPFAFSTWKLQNKDNLTLKRPLGASIVKWATPNSFVPLKNVRTWNWKLRWHATIAQNLWFNHIFDLYNIFL